MTEAVAKINLLKEVPNRVIDSVEKVSDGYVISAYDKKTGPSDLSGTIFKVSNNGSVRKLSLEEIFDL